MNKKLIGIPMYNLGENSAGATKPYLELFRQYGTVILLSPDTFIPNLDLLVLPGGKDVADGNSEEFSFLSSDNERFLEWFDKNTLPLYIKNETPIYGICRGFQALMKYFKIPLVQHIGWNHGYSEDETKLDAHALLLCPALKKFQESNKKIGSWHHQGVTLTEFNKQAEFDLLGYAPHKGGEDYSIIEFAQHKTLPIIGEQSHPERNYSLLENELIQKLLNWEKTPTFETGMAGKETVKK